MTTSKYEWAIKGKFNGDPEGVAKEIESLGDDIKPKQIVEYARENESSELHKCFTWDDSKAAELYRLVEARSIISNLKVTYIEAEKEEPKQLRIAYRVEKGGGYVQTKTIIKNEDQYNGMLEMAKRELKSFERKYSTLTELQPIFDAIDTIV